MIALKWHTILAICVGLVYVVFSASLHKKVSELRKKHNYITQTKDFISTKQKRFSDIDTPNIMKKNNTKREYVYYPDGGHRGHFREGGDDYRYFQGVHGGGGGCECEGDQPECDECSDMPDIPEYTHTHHVIRYHHHVGKFTGD